MSRLPAPGLILAAPASGCGKTVLTLGLLRHFARSGLAVGSAKVGPDYIDPAFHAAATGRPCVNLDPWAMSPADLAACAAQTAPTGLILCEGVMGLFDGATATTGSTADVAAASGWPVVLILDVRAQAASAAALLSGFVRHRADVAVTGVILNRVGSERHVAVIREACAATVPEVAFLGAVPRVDGLVLPERHLGLVQAREHPALPALLDGAADLIAAHVDTAALFRLARPWRTGKAPAATTAAVPPPGARIALADDAAFAFRYPHVLDAWRRAGAEIRPFSPLANEPPVADADAVYLPGGYPELHAGRLAANAHFLAGLRAAAGRGAAVFGECGGYMVLGEVLVDASGQAHAMAGLLPLATSFESPRLHLGYRQVRTVGDGPLGPAGAGFRGHEFHYATVVREAGAPPLFSCRDAGGRELGATGLVAGRVFGSFVHLIAAER